MPGCKYEHGTEVLDGLRVCFMQCWCGEYAFCQQHEHGDDPCDCPEAEAAE